MGKDTGKAEKPKAKHSFQNRLSGTPRKKRLSCVAGVVPGVGWPQGHPRRCLWRKANSSEVSEDVSLSCPAVHRPQGTKTDEKGLKGKPEAPEHWGFYEGNTKGVLGSLPQMWRVGLVGLAVQRTVTPQHSDFTEG